jgi:voltage-gated potassium channel
MMRSIGDGALIVRRRVSRAPIFDGDRIMDRNFELHSSRRLRRTIQAIIEIGGLAMLALLVYFLLPLNRRHAALIAGAFVFAAIVALVPLAIRRGRRVLTSEQPVLVAAQSLAIALTLLVVSFASMYFVLGTAHEGQINGIHTKIDAIYYTVTILSTVGFGDVTATGQGARALVAIHMIVNLVFLAVAIRVLSSALEQRKGTGPNTTRAGQPTV